MRTEETIVNLIFDAGKGSVAQSAREAVCGEPYGTLPTPVRAGYRFDGWYLGDTRVTAETVLDSADDVRLQARWVRERANKKKASSLKRQKWAVVALAATAVVLLIAWAIVAQLISVYYLTDTYTVDGKEYSDRYTIKREDGVYKMFDSDGTLMPTRENAPNVYIAAKSGNQYSINPDTGEYRLIAIVDPDTLDDYEAAAGTALLLYPEISSSYVFDIEVTNEHGTYKFVHTPKGTYIEGFEDALFSYDTDLYARLIVGCGWTTASRKLTKAADVAKLADGSIDYSVYGLDTPTASYTIRGVLFKKDDSGNDLYSGGKPVVDYKTETNDDGSTYQSFKPDPDKNYTVHIGNLTPSRDGYYVRIEGKNSIYILGAGYLKSTVMVPVESMVKPQAVYAVSVNTHSMADNFMLRVLDDGWMNIKDYNISDSELIVALSYEPLELRQYTMNTSFPYVNFGVNLMDGYRINASRAQEILGLFFSLECERCVKLGVNADTLKEFGFDENVMMLQYGVDVDESDGVNTFLTNSLFISTVKNENGNYYVASTTFDMIVEVEPYYLPFIEWDTADWYEEYFMQISLSYLKGLSLTIGDQSYDFSFSHDRSYCYYVTEENGVKMLKAVDLSNGYLEESGTKLYYKTSSGETYEVTARIDFDTVENVSYRDAMMNPKKGNIIYMEEIYYYVNAKGQNVRVRPDFVNNDIVRRDDVLCFVGTLNGQSVDIAVNRQFGEPIYRHKEGLETVVTVATSNPQISSPQYSKNNGLLDYTIKEEYRSDTTGETLYEMISAETNYSRLHLALVNFTLEGDVKEKDIMDRYGMTVDQFIASRQPTATIRLQSEDQAKFFNGYVYYDDEIGEDVRAHTENEIWNVEINFYRYTDNKAIVTLRMLDENGNAVGQEYGRFYVKADFLDTLHGYVEDLLNERVIPD